MVLILFQPDLGTLLMLPAGAVCDAVCRRRRGCGTSH